MIKLTTKLYSLMALIVLSSQALCAASGITICGMPAEEIATKTTPCTILLKPSDPLNEVSIISISDKGIDCAYGSIDGIDSLHQSIRQITQDTPPSFKAGSINFKGHRVIMGGHLISKSDITLEVFEHFKISPLSIFQLSGKLILTFSNPISLIRQIVLTSDPATAVTMDDQTLYLGSVWGEFSGLPTETAQVFMSGYQTLELAINTDVVRTLLRK